MQKTRPMGCGEGRFFEDIDEVAAQETCKTENNLVNRGIGLFSLLLVVRPGAPTSVLAPRKESLMYNWLGDPFLRSVGPVDAVAPTPKILRLTFPVRKEDEPSELTVLEFELETAFFNKNQGICLCQGVLSRVDRTFC